MRVSSRGVATEVETMTEPEFVLLEQPPVPVEAAHTKASLLKRSGRRGVRRDVLVDLGSHRPRRWVRVLVVVAVVGGAAAAAVVVMRRRRARAPMTDEPAAPPEVLYEAIVIEGASS
jgi:hypothetical protein